MAGRRNFNPSTIASQQREIVRSQSDFKGGVWHDIPASKVPSDGIYELVNGIAHPWGIQGRPGSSIITSVLPKIAGSSIIASKSGYTVTITSGYVLTSADVGRYWGWLADSANEPILSVNLIDNSFTTDTESTISGFGFIRGEVWAFEWHSSARRFVVHVDTRIFTVPWPLYPLALWTEVARNCSKAPAQAKGRLREVNDKMLLYNSNGMYVIDIANNRYYLANAPLPMDKNADDAESTYGRRLTVAFAALGGDGRLRDRTKEGVALLHQSGCLSLRSANPTAQSLDTHGLHDFWESWGANRIDSTNYRTYTLYPTIGNSAQQAEYHFSHYAVFGTLHFRPIGQADDLYTIDPIIGKANDPEMYTWMDDVPFIKCFIARREASSTTLDSVAVSGETVTYGVPAFRGYDAGATIRFSDASTDTISALAAGSSSRVTTAGNTAIANVAACIGASKVASVSQSGTTLSITAGSYDFASTEVGQRIYFSDGTEDIITAYSGVHAVTVAKSRTFTGAAAWIPASRTYRDYITDDQLRIRKGFLVKTRFLQPMPNCNEGCVSPGMVWGCISGGPFVYYSSMEKDDRSTLGYYDPSAQVHRSDDAVTYLSAFDRTVIAYGKNSFTLFDLSSLQTYNDETDPTASAASIRPIMQVVLQKFVKGIGCLDRGSVRKTKEGFDIVITSDRELRIHDGTQFGPNLIASRYQKKFDRLQASTATHYDKRSGFIVWGTQASA